MDFKFYKKKLLKNNFNRISPKFNQVESMTRGVYQFCSNWMSSSHYIMGTSQILSQIGSLVTKMMGTNFFSYTHRLTMCGLKKLASGVFRGSWKVLAGWQHWWWWWQWWWKWAKNIKSRGSQGGLNDSFALVNHLLICSRILCIRQMTVDKN